MVEKWILKNLNELKQQLKEVWTKIPLQQCQKLPNHTVINYFDLLVLRLDLESQGVLDRKSGLHSDMWKHSFSHECTCVSHVMPPSIQFLPHVWLICCTLKKECYACELCKKNRQQSLSLFSVILWQRWNGHIKHGPKFQVMSSVYALMN